MLIRILLLTILAMMGHYVFLRRTRLPIHIVVVVALLGAAATLVVRPELSNHVAHALGVGRGVDLISYIVQLTLLFVAIHYYAKFVSLQAELTQVVRELADVRHELERIG